MQILLDSKQSYRVLTGSNVIKTSIGEEIENYDIGGARILGRYTGIVDIIVVDKIHLIHSVQNFHKLFCTENQLQGIARETENSKIDYTHEDIVFSESTIKDNIDSRNFIPFKKEYFAAMDMIGGFGKIAGRRCLIMGPKKHSGLRSNESIIRARELLRIAHHTGSSQILIFGKLWQQTPDYFESIRMQPRSDYMTQSAKKSNLRINIITHIDGLKYFEINHSADAVIFINDKDDPACYNDFDRKNSTFIASSFAEAFDISAKLIELMAPIPAASKASEPIGAPSIPEDASIPYDMIESVILRVADQDTFVEFFKGMNETPSGPDLITGIAQLNGKTVGIIADQPNRKGGGADAFGTEKFRVFTEILNKRNLPLIMLSNSSGFVPGSQQERYRIQAIGAESINANVMGRIPVVSVVLKQNYGGRLIHAFNKFLRPGIVYLALEDSALAVLGVDAAFDIVGLRKYNKLIEQNKNEEAQEFRNKFYSYYIEKSKARNDATETGLLDWIIPDISGLRGHLIKGLELAIKKTDEVFNQ